MDLQANPKMQRFAASNLSIATSDHHVDRHFSNYHPPVFLFFLLFWTQKKARPFNPPCG